LRDLLRIILAAKREEVVARRRQAPQLLDDAQAPRRSFVSALSGSGVAVVAEIKRRSPSAGALLPPGADVSVLARRLAEAGAAAISVLTDRTWFGGSLDDLVAVRRAVDLPILRKDFLIDPYQIHEARACGADAVLLIARLLSPAELAGLVAEAVRLGLAAVVEIHAEHEIAAAARSGAPVLGFNCRDLDTLTLDFPGMLRLRARAPAGRVALAESGVRTREDLARVRDAGFDAALVGETLMRAHEPASRLGELLAPVGERP